ncbi:porin family protein [Labrys sp. LIt4]|uniref:outer membrane protein n=1 Tax=Labrys sp. LIt4 TaxID=2821355 RepID=UPI001AE020A1|nr:outer membrane protein [Labrys sp. LIt4]MBP0580764.1 porin family protein [Labrys sp. LIt4]
MQILRNALLAGVVILAPAAAFAADLAPPPVEPVAPEIVPSFTWTGFYAGLSAGYGRGNLDTDLKAVPTARGEELENALGFGLNGGIARVKDTANGFVGGGQIGYNYQLDPHWVVGAEADLQYAGLDSKKTFIGNQNIPVTVKTELDWFGTARLRAGYAFDNVLVYGTGGLAYGRVKSKVSTAGTSLSGSETKFGWALGAGAEYALTQNWTVRAEYLYVDLGKAETIKANSEIAQVTAKADVSVHTVRAGVNYKF